LRGAQLDYAVLVGADLTESDLRAAALIVQVDPTVTPTQRIIRTLRETQELSGS
jgi:Pentapeptide repeats (8 copies)